MNFDTVLTSRFTTNPTPTKVFLRQQTLDALENIEEKISVICNGDHSVFVACVFMPKIKDYIMYTKSPDELGNALESFAKSHGQFNFEFGGHEDPSWEQYNSFAEPE